MAVMPRAQALRRMGSRALTMPRGVYERKPRNSPFLGRSNGKTLEQRFWEKVDRDQMGPGCWYWIGSINGNGYGNFWVDGKVTLAHRTVFKMMGLELSPLYVDHQCMNTRCCNPAHLRFVDAKVNGLENCESPMAKNARKTHCKHGHPLSGDNIVLILRPRVKNRWGNWKTRTSTTRACLTCYPHAANSKYRVA